MQSTATASKARLPLWDYRRLILTLAWRDVSSRYRGSVGGLLWSLITPLLLLAVYTAVFSGVFKTRWGQSGTGGPLDYALQMFVGLIIHGLVAECINRAPTLMLNHVSYVKRVVFPLETLVVVVMLSALFHTVMSFIILAGFHLVIHHTLALTVLWLPVIIFPYLVMLTGVSWMLAAIGVYLRDIQQVVGLVTTILLFLSPVFYPASMLPQKLQIIFQLNPLTLIIEQSREVIIEGRHPDLFALALYSLIAGLVAWLGYRSFQLLRKGFADVL